MADLTNEYSKLPESIMYNSSTYADIYENSFSKLEKHTFRDADSTVGSLINQVKTLQAAGDFEGAADLINSTTTTSGHPLSDYIIDTEYVNAIDEETRNLEILCLNAIQGIFYAKTEPVLAISKYDVWIGSQE